MSLNSQLSFGVSSALIIDGTITNADINSSAAIAASKIAGLSSSATTDTTNAANISSGILPAARMPAHTGDITTVAGAVATTLATVNSNVGTFNGVTINAKGLVTATAVAAGSFTSLAITGFTSIPIPINGGISHSIGMSSVHALLIHTDMYIGKGKNNVTYNVAIGFGGPLKEATGIFNTAVGGIAGVAITTGHDNTCFGAGARVASTGSYNTGIGALAMYDGATGSNNTGIGAAALHLNTIASNNTAVGYQAGYNSGSTITAGSFIVGGSYTIITPGSTDFTLIGAANSNVGTSFTATNIGTGNGNGTAGGNATGNTALGFSAGQSNTTGNHNTLVGRAAGLALTTGSSNTFVGGYDISTGGSGAEITSGSNNTILGAYNGNQGSLDIRTASNYVVLSDGDGNPRAYWNGAAATFGGALTVTGALSATTTVTVPAVFGGSGASDSVYIRSTSGNNNRSGINIGNALNADNGGISFSTAGASVETVRMRISGTTGNVLIGNTVAVSGAKLEVTGAISATGNLSGGTSGTGYSFSGSAPAGSLTLDSSGNLGIGAASPIFLTDILSGTANTGSNVNNPSQLSVTGANKTLTGGGATVFVNSNSNTAIDTGGSIALTGRNTTSSTNSVVWGVIKGAKENGTSTNGAGYLAFATASHSAGAPVEGMRLDSSGNLGLGVTPTSSWLTSAKVMQLGISAVLFGRSASNQIQFGSNFYIDTGGTNRYINTEFASKYVQDSGQHQFYSAPSGTAGNAITFTQAMTLDASGNLGLGTSLPQGPLDVTATGATVNQFLTGGAGNNLVTGIFRIGSGLGRGASVQGFRGGSSNIHSLDFYTYNAADVFGMRLDSSGNLLVGTTSSNGKISLYSTSNVAMSVDGTGQYKAYELFASGVRKAYFNIDSTNSITSLSSTYGILTFSTGDTERARFNSNGYFKASNTAAYLGSTASYHELRSNAGDSVVYIQNTNAANPYGIEIDYTAVDPNVPGFQFLAGYGTSNLRFALRSNGGLANYSANDANLSDRREKTNFAPATSYLDKICAIPVQTFNYIDQNLEEDGGLTLGVVAQDVQAVAPELVMESNWAKKDDEPKMRLSIYQTDLQYALMKCIQEQQALITQLTARITALETS